MLPRLLLWQFSIDFLDQHDYDNGIQIFGSSVTYLDIFRLLLDELKVISFIKSKFVLFFF